MPVRPFLLSAAVMALVLPSAARAQTRASERAHVTQIVNGTSITLDFSRPVARGRTNLFGGVVHWGEVWTPGANWATTIETDKPIRLNGNALAAGKYSIWMKPQQDQWTVYLHRTSRLYHDAPIPENDVQLGFTVTPMQGEHMEALAWYFPVIGPRTATARMHWGTTMVPIEIETQAFEPATVPAEMRARYIGDYAVEGRDPTTTGPLKLTIRILEENGRLAGRWGNAPIMLIPVREGEFGLGFMRAGELFDAAEEMTIRMVMDGDRARGVELLWEGRAFAKGDRSR
jgi:Protein of unknown function (DUF2911)